MRILAFKFMTKKLTTISLFIFAVITISILTAGLVFYQNKKDNQASNSNNLIQNTLKNTNTINGSLTLDMKEISRHNSPSDCWMLINGKVYNITSYFGSHPGGNGTMSATCGKDATTAYMTKDPNANTSGSRSSHSSKAISLLANYYLGDLNQTLNSQTISNKINSTNNIQTPKNSKYEDEYEDD